MAQRRMISMQVVDTDLFLDMPASAQMLYFHLNMRADDDGFVASPRKIMKICNSSDDDYKVLMAKRFVIPFESGICVIRHWRIHNYIQKDRYHPTMYRAEKAQIEVENGHYEPLDTGCIQDVSRMETEVRLGKVRQGKARGSADAPEDEPGSNTISPRDTVKAAFVEAIGQLLPTTAWPDIPKQMAAITDMAQMTRDTQPTTPIETPEQFAQLVVSTYCAMKRKGKSDYWKTAGFEPRAIKQRFGDVVSEIAGQYESKESQEEELESYYRMYPERRPKE